MSEDLRNKIDFDLAEIVGKKVARIEGYPSAEFGRDVPVFKIFRVVFEDGSAIFAEGEHDMPYLPCDEVLSEEKLLALLPKEDET